MRKLGLRENSNLSNSSAINIILPYSYILLLIKRKTTKEIIRREEILI